MTKFLIRMSVSFTALIACLFFSPLNAWAAQKDFNVFDVRKSLPLSDEEPTYHDYYLNMGIEDGIKVGTVLVVYRKVPVLDIYRNKAQADLISPVAQIRIIHAQNSLSIARLVKIVDQKRVPILGQAAVLVGDRVEMAGNEIDEKDNQASAETTTTIEKAKAIESGPIPQSPAPIKAENPT